MGTKTDAVKGHLNGLLVLGLAIAFYFFFMTTKHDATLSQIIPFADDPYDAVGSFGVETAVFLGILSLIRAFRLLYRTSVPSEERKVFLARTQMAVVLAVSVTVVADAVAMLRHPSLWAGQRAGYELVALLGGVTLFAVVVGILVRLSARGIGLPTIPDVWKRTAVVSLATVVVLAFYPENLIQSTFGHLFTIVAGALLLFAPVWALGIALVPYDLKGQGERAGVSGRLSRRKYQWGIVVLLGIVVGFLAVLGESSEGGGGGIPLARLAFLVSVYVGLEIAAVLIGYGFLRRPLGLFRRGS